jgi:5'(3')-deoxyribonucleotidase
LHNDLSLAERRVTGNRRAAFLMAKAEKIANLLYKFPFVRGIGVSGSISKNFADEDADIDYFIITTANRLWIARTLLHLYKKNPFLKNSDQHYCMNYFIDEADLLIEEKNIYTATELFTLIPVAGNGSMKKFFSANEWSYNYFPNRDLPVVKEDVKKSGKWPKRIAESFLNNKLGDWLDDYFMQLTTKRWKKKEDEQKLNTKGERMGLKTRKHCSKPNPIFFHDWFMDNYEKRVQEIGKKWDLKINAV